MIGDKIKQRLEELGLKQKELAHRLNISPSTLNGYITGYRSPDINTLKKISDELKVSSSYLLDSETEIVAENNTRDYVINEKINKILETVKGDPKKLASTKKILERESIQNLLDYLEDKDDDYINLVMDIAFRIDQREKNKDVEEKS
jgi:transcriptional regulator with XRE-family HTH domain